MVIGGVKSDLVGKESQKMGNQVSHLKLKEDIKSRPRPSLKVVSDNTKKRLKKDKQELVLSYRENGRKLARSFLKGWNIRMAYEDIDSLVDVALCEAAIRYKKDKGAAFMTFFYYHLRGYLIRAVACRARSNNIFFAVAEAQREVVGDWKPTPEDVRHWLSPEFSSLSESEKNRPESILLRKEKKFTCYKAISELDPLEQEVITRSYMGNESLIDVAKSLGYSRCHISRVKKKAIEKLRNILSKTGEFFEDYGKTAPVLPFTPNNQRGRRRRTLVIQSEIRKGLLQQVAFS